MTNAPNSLEPCLKCGGEGVISLYHGIAINGWVVDCADDMATGDGSHSTSRYPTEAEAIAAWNTLTPKPADSQLVEVVTNGAYERDDYGPVADIARTIASFADQGPNRRRVYLAAKREIAALAPHLSPSGDAERDRLKAAYIAGAEAVHYGLIYSNPYRDPDFGEAAGDYADEVLHQDAIAHREAGE